MKQSPMETVYQSMMIGLMSVVAASAVVFPAIFLTQFHKYRKESAPKKIKLSIQTENESDSPDSFFIRRFCSS